MEKKIYQIILGILYISLIVFFSYSCLQNGDSSGNFSVQVSKGIANVLNSIFKTSYVVDDNFVHLVRKLIGHYGYFVLLGIVSSLFYYSFNNLGLVKKIIINFLSALVFALISEFIFQLITSGRAASIIDVLIDYSGFITSAIIISTIYIVRNKNKTSEMAHK